MPGKPHSHPCVVYNGKDPLHSEGFEVCFEHIKIPVLDGISGAALAMAMYWSFNVEYEPTVHQTLTLIEHLVGVKYTKATPSVVKLITSLNARI